MLSRTLDNIKKHCKTLIYMHRREQLVESVGAIIIYLPPYACDLSPIGKGFGRAKQIIQDNERGGGVVRPEEGAEGCVRLNRPGAGDPVLPGHVLRILDDC
jgi:hypothetical protein